MHFAGPKQFNLCRLSGPLMHGRAGPAEADRHRPSLIIPIIYRINNGGKKMVNKPYEQKNFSLISKGSKQL